MRTRQIANAKAQSLGARLLWAWMHRSRLSQRQAAKILGFPYTTFNHYLHDRRQPCLEHAVAMSQRAGVAVDTWLVFSSANLPTTWDNRVHPEHESSRFHQ